MRVASVLNKSEIDGVMIELCQQSARSISVEQEISDGVAIELCQKSARSISVEQE